MIATDFGGRSLILVMTKITEYKKIVAALLTAMPIMAENASHNMVIF
jgi:hypothetical protein